MLDLFLFDFDNTIAPSEIYSMEDGRLVRSEVDDSLRPYEGIERLLKQIRSYGKKTGLVTNSRAKDVLPFLEKNKIRGLFDLIITLDDVGIDRKKPHPYPIILACSRLGVKPGKNVIFVGDRYMDVKAAYDANVLPVLAGWSLFAPVSLPPIAVLTQKEVGDLARADDFSLAHDLVGRFSRMNIDFTGNILNPSTKSKAFVLTCQGATNLEEKLMQFLNTFVSDASYKSERLLLTCLPNEDPAFLALIRRPELSLFPGMEIDFDILARSDQLTFTSLPAHHRAYINQATLSVKKVPIEKFDRLLIITRKVNTGSSLSTAVHLLSKYCAGITAVAGYLDPDRSNCLCCPICAGNMVIRSRGSAKTLGWICATMTGHYRHALASNENKMCPRCGRAMFVDFSSALGKSFNWCSGIYSVERCNYTE